MSIKADHKYQGEVGTGSCLIETQSGTVGYQVQLTCDDGDTSFMIWLTAKNKDRAAKYFEVLGVDPENLKSHNYFDSQLAQDIEGVRVSFTTKEEEYNGKKSIKVGWMGKPSAGANVASAAAAFFGGEVPVVQPKPPDGPGITDDDIPF